MKTSPPTHSISVPPNVRFDTRLSASAKLLYGEIAHLSQEQGFCSQNDHYFAKLYQVTIKTANAWVARLQEAGYLRVRYDASGQQRLLYPEALSQEAANPNQLTFLS